MEDHAGGRNRIACFTVSANVDADRKPNVKTKHSNKKPILYVVNLHNSSFQSPNCLVDSRDSRSWLSSVAFSIASSQATICSRRRVRSCLSSSLAAALTMAVDQLINDSAIVRNMLWLRMPSRLADSKVSCRKWFEFCTPCNAANICSRKR